MSKAVFRPGEVALSSIKVVLDPPHVFPELAYLSPEEEEQEEVLAVEEYRGPTADDLRREAEAFKEQWEQEKAEMIRAAQAQAGELVEEARRNAAGEIERGNAGAEALKQEAREEAERIIEGGRQKAAEIEAGSAAAFEEARKGAEEAGREEGRKAGFAGGQAEVERLIERTRTVLERAQDKRGEILAETERQIIDLVLLISRKVVKVISEHQKNVVVSNVIQALRKVKSRGDIIIRVNLEDVQLATEHTKDFIRLAEGGSSIQIAEDSTVESGGCVIETDFGEIDGRISSQLAELETKILEISPLKNRPKAAPSGGMNPGGFTEEDGKPVD
jgi:flagellar assembly protein FliH